MAPTVYTQYPQEDPAPHTYPPLPPRWGFMLKALLGVFASLIVAVLVSANAHAQDMSAQLEEYNAMCFDEQGEWLKTDGCIESAESLGIEIDNLLESERKGCTLEDMYEDYSCKGPQGPSSPSSSSVGEQDNSSATDTGCVTIDMTDPEVSGQDIDILTQQFGFDAKADNDDMLYSPECFEQGIVPFDFESMQNNPCYDVLGDSAADVWVEYIGCPEVPVTQEGTYAPLNWRDRLIELKFASSQKEVSPSIKASSTARPTTSTPVKTVAYAPHDPRDTGRSQGQVVSESKRAEVHATRRARWRASSRRKRPPRRPRARRSKGVNQQH